MILLLTAAAWAADAPEASIADDGTVTVSADIQASADQVRAALADPVQAAHLAREVLAVESAPAGLCQALHVTVQGPWSPLQYQSLRCPTATGFHEVLTNSSDLSKMDASWTLTPTSSGTRIEYRVRTELDTIVPEALVRKGEEHSALQTVRALIDRIVQKARLR